MNLAKAAVASEADCIAKGKPRAAFCLVAHSPPGGTTVHTWGEATCGNLRCYVAGTWGESRCTQDQCRQSVKGTRLEKAEG